MKNITIKIANKYGSNVAVPMCISAQTFADIAGTKTLTKQTLENIKKLGYNVKVHQEIKSLNDLTI